MQPDITRMHGKGPGHHSLYELKVACPITTAAAGVGRAATKAGFATTEDRLLSDILGGPATATATAAVGAYADALAKGHEVTAIIHESYGGFAPGAVKLLHKLGSQHGAKLGHDELTAPWCARSFRSYHSMCISVALHRAAAEEIIDAVYLDTSADYGAAAH